MYFPKHEPSKHDVKGVYDEEDGSLVENEIQNSNASQSYIPESLHQHVDNIFLNSEVKDGTSILCFIYETSHETVYVWTSPAAMVYCNMYFADYFDEIENL